MNMPPGSESYFPPLPDETLFLEEEQAVCPSCKSENLNAVDWFNYVGTISQGVFNFCEDCRTSWVVERKS